MRIALARFTAPLFAWIRARCRSLARPGNISRFWALLFAWIPNISAVSTGLQVTIGIAASVSLHLFALLVIVKVADVVQKPVDLTQVKPPQPEELELTIVEPEPPRIAAVPLEAEKHFIDSRGLAASKPAENPVFESDKDMTAASEKAATGEVPLPSQEGKGRLDNVFDTTKASVGSVKEPPAPAIELAAAAPPMPAVKEQPPAKEIPAENKAEATPPTAAPSPATPAPKTVEKPDAAALAKTAMEKIREVEKKRDDEIALSAKPLPPLPDPVTKLEKPAPEPTILPAIPVRPTPQQLAKLTPPSPLLKTPGKPGYQPEQEKSRVEGRITNRGKSAVDAVSTPLGRYKKQVYDAIGSRWLYYVKGQMDLLAIGSAKVSFYVTRAGRVQEIRVEGNTANASFAEVCERAIRDAEISQPPAGSLDQMRDGRLEYSITFTLYSFHE